LRLASEFKVVDAGVTVTVGVSRAGDVTVTEAVPLAEPYSVSPL
jgi:hypothetical protein